MAADFVAVSTNNRYNNRHKAYEEIEAAAEAEDVRRKKPVASEKGGEKKNRST